MGRVLRVIGSAIAEIPNHRSYPCTLVHKIHYIREGTQRGGHRAEGGAAARVLKSVNISGISAAICVETAYSPNKSVPVRVQSYRKAIEIASTTALSKRGDLQRPGIEE